MFYTTRTVIVEGRYDKIRLSSLLDALIITTEGFGIFNDNQRQKLIKTLAMKNGLLIITDSDAAGFQIRNFIKNIAKNADIIHCYIPDVYGKEGRKDTPSKEGKIGVEGMKTEALEEALRKSGLFKETANELPRKEITHADLYKAGLSGTKNSSEKRRRLLQKAGLPQRLSGSQLIHVLNSYLTYDEFQALIEE